jgi:hypothetical protein
MGGPLIEWHLCRRRWQRRQCEEPLMGIQSGRRQSRTGESPSATPRTTGPLPSDPVRKCAASRLLHRSDRSRRATRELKMAGPWRPRCRGRERSDTAIGRSCRVEVGPARVEGDPLLGRQRALMTQTTVVLPRGTARRIRFHRFRLQIVARLDPRPTVGSHAGRHLCVDQCHQVLGTAALERLPEQGDAATTFQFGDDGLELGTCQAQTVGVGVRLPCGRGSRRSRRMATLADGVHQVHQLVKRQHTWGHGGRAMASPHCGDPELSGSPRWQPIGMRSIVLCLIPRVWSRAAFDERACEGTCQR